MPSILMPYDFPLHLTVFLPCAMPLGLCVGYNPNRWSLLMTVTITSCTSSAIARLCLYRALTTTHSYHCSNYIDHVIVSPRPTKHDLSVPIKFATYAGAAAIGMIPPDQDIMIQQRTLHANVYYACSYRVLDMEMDCECGCLLGGSHE
ncbi:hypothetical protein PYCCODRAFT_289748 [Trametes coccinea BRFM310]|uniref:Uncharacterized protein n=1 Tax=Trametes coccinea (strain BRFM310) TaxID=1353009 RepID=A0A1Y2ISZ4_TRAC3|nr:hypothetical protein PYCCODRAFT_289748 [Trametes coccinea BRFM310]